jgi:probable phosphoglycerate mutase
MKNLYFIRHGQTETNVLGMWTGITETPLTPKGRQQAKAAGKKAKKLDIDLIVASPLSRAHDTAKIVAKEIGYPVKDIKLSSLLIERHFGEAEGTVWRPDINIDDVADVESVDTLINRARLALEWIKTLEGQNVLVVSHGSLGRAMRYVLLPEHTFDNSPRLENAVIEHWFGVIG